ncbi:MAG: hypothetical protein OEV40_12220 [Acidimicrobiia bacterium]|nr:hypothetical protein [Acidimicrobiia bacterium]
MTGEAEAEPHWSGRRRAPAYAVVRQRWPIGLLAVSLNLGLTYVLLVVSLRSVGIAASEIGPAVVIWRLFYGLLAFLRGPRHPQPVLPGAPGPPR